MPKKTKKQKIHAVQRHTIQPPTKDHAVEETAHQIPQQTGSVYRFTATAPATNKKDFNGDHDGTLKEIIHDIRKTLFLAGISCVVLVTLSFLLH
jgi:hypothetical protein